MATERICTRCGKPFEPPACGCGSAWTICPTCRSTPPDPLPIRSKNDRDRDGSPLDRTRQR